MPLTGMYVLQGVDPAAVAIAPFDVKVIDVYDSNGRYFTNTQVAQMGGGDGGGLLLGYFSIGEAEIYRDYFGTIPTTAIGPENPDWDGNYEVAYWTTEWRGVATAYLDRMIAAGYDGIYFDVVDEYQQAWARLNAPGGDAEGAMVDLVRYLADYAHARNPTFKIWANNAEELLENAAYLQAIDGMFKENLFYQDNGSVQPKSETTYSLGMLDLARDAGKDVIAIEYVSGATKIADVQAKAAAAGVGAYVADLALNGVNYSGVLPGQTVAGRLHNGGTGGDSLSGGAAADTLYGFGGDDTLNGGAGADRLGGGPGNDLYITDRATDTIIEAANAGIDTVRTTSAAFTLSANVENLLATNAIAHTLTGNTIANAISGNAGADTISGGGGNDTLDGGAGIDRLAGGAGNDLYVVTEGDVVVEAANYGYDTVRATSGTTHTAAANIETLVLGEGTPVTGNGNILANTLIGNAGGNVLRGMGGGDVLHGMAGTDILIGGEGQDTLHGGAGADQFRLTALADSTLAAPDRVMDFTHGDRIALNMIDANALIAGDQAFAYIGSGPFTGVAGQLRVTDMGDAWLASGDMNGDGAGDFAIAIEATGAPVAGWFIL